MNSIKNDNVWYFRTTDTLADDDKSTDSIALHVDQITGFVPYGRTTLYIWFKKMHNHLNRMLKLKTV